MTAEEWMDLAEKLRDLSWCARHTCGDKVMDQAPQCTACSLLVAQKNIVRDYRWVAEKKRTA
jgi:ribosomal protein L37E